MQEEDLNSVLGFEAQERRSSLTRGELGQQLETSVESRPWYMRLTTRFFLIGGTGLLGMFLLFNLFSGGQQESVATTENTAETQALRAQLDAQKQQTDDLKSQIAIDEQSKVIPVKAVPKKPVTVSKPVPSNMVYRPNTIRTGSTVPTLQPAPPISIAPPSRPFIPPAQLKPITSVPATPSEDPMQAWARLASLGQYASGDRESSAATPASYTPAVYSQTAPSTPVEMEYSLATGGSSSSPIAPVLGVNLAAGQTAQAKLKTSIQWASDIDISQQTYLVELTEALAPTLPKGTILTVQPDQISESGFIRLKATTATVNGSEHSLPDGLQVVAAKGGLIQASRKGAGGRGAGSILATALLSGISRGASELIKPQSSTLITRDGFGQVVTNNQVNPWAGVAQGATESLATGFQSQLGQSSPSNPYFIVSSGTRLQVLVTQSIAL